MSLLKYINKPYEDKFDLHDQINYCLGKTENVIYDYASFGVNHLNKETICNSMIHTKKLFNKEEGKQFYHFIISIHPKRKISLENKLTYASFILNDLGLKIEKTGFQCLGIIHVGIIENLFNKGIINYEENVHIHFVVNSVSFIDGHKLVRIYTLLNSIIVFLKSDYPYLNWDSKIYVK